jgi:plastocyanin
MRWKRLLCVLVGLGLVAAACGGDEGGTITLDGQTANDHGTEDVSGQTEVEFEMDDFYFSPTVLRGEPGQTITLSVENEGENAHTFTADELGVDQQVEAGEDAHIDVTFPASGQVVFVCRFHEGQGMRGALEVS